MGYKSKKRGGAVKKQKVDGGERETLNNNNDGTNTNGEGTATDLPHKNPYMGKDKSYALVRPENNRFEQYYKKMGIIPDEQEYEKMLTSFTTFLPTTFRINTSIGKNLIADIKEQIANLIEKMPEKIELEGGKTCYRPVQLAWYPDNLGFHCDIPKREFRKNQALEAFQQFLLHHDEQGHITRQEAVSMIPPIFLDVHPGHYVLDMCAAPGSKTTQIIESLHANVYESNHKVPEGLIIANDADKKRSYMLVHQTARLGSPSLLVTNYSAQNFPLLYLPDDSDSTKSNAIKFDRILADVPCSGDGTLRKNPDLWKRWTPHGAASLHKTQALIAIHAAQLLKVGGRMVYSTCSLNPIENEAVVMELIRKTEGAIKIVDVSSQYPGLARRPGVTSWPVLSNDLIEYKSIEEVPVSQKEKITKSFFPPTQEEADAAGLKNCMRVYPHLQDSGGFFITVLEKVKDLPNQIGNRSKGSLITTEDQTTTPPTTTDSPTTTTTSTTTTTTVVEEEGEKIGEYKKNAYNNEEPFIELPDKCKELLPAVSQFYGISPSFPMDQLLTRSDSSYKSKTLYLVTKTIEKLIKADTGKKLKVINAGVKLFQYHDGHGTMDCPYRISQDSVNWIQASLSDKRKIIFEHKDLETILRLSEPKFTEFSPVISQQLEKLEPGCFLAIIKENNESTSANIKSHTSGMIFATWRGKNSIHLLVPKHEIKSMANMLNVPIEIQKGDKSKTNNNNVDNTTTTSTTTTTTSNDNTPASENKE